MSEGKKICDECGKEIEEFGTGLYGNRWKLWVFINRRTNADFCSDECLVKFVNREFGKKKEKK
ncbi:unnamed protein product [marine sediment metagenome]|uniref:MYM-type domain-containing protein n=1 Tax=marine sediment metagenome TaxID=412755 RepID=X1E3R8_9ZZZZ